MTEQPSKISPGPAPLDATDDSSSRPGAPPLQRHPVSGAAAVRKRRQIAVACNQCRSKKIKCPGERPQCSTCTKRDIPCDYDADPDTTRAATLKRKQGELQSETTRLLRLFELLRDRPEQESQVILGRIRSGEALEATLRYAEHGDIHAQRPLVGFSPQLGVLADIPHPYQTSHAPDIDVLFVSYDGSPVSGLEGERLPNYLSDNPLSERSSPAAEQSPHVTFFGQRPGTLSFDSPTDGSKTADEQRGLLLDAHDLYDDRLRGIRPEIWTSVEISSQAMANLLSLFLSWLHPLYPMFDERFFLEDLFAERTENCTTLLVNCMCCYACTMYAPLDPTARPFGRLFYDHAHHIWARAPPTIPTVSAAGILSINSLLFNQHDLGMDIIKTGYSIARFLGMFHEHDRQYELPEDPVQARLSKSAAAAAWGLFNLSSAYSLSYPSPTICPKEPSFPVTFDGYHVGEHRTAWPRSENFSNMPSRYPYLCQMSSIVNSAAIFQHRMMEAAMTGKELDNAVAWKMALYLLQKLVAWRKTLPGQMKQIRNCSPAWTDMLMVPHSVLLTIFRPFVNKDRFSSKLHTDCLRQINVLIGLSRMLWGIGPNLCASIGLVVKAGLSALQIENDRTLTGSGGGIPKPHQALAAEMARYFANCVDVLFEVSKGSVWPGRVLLSLLIAAENKYADRLPPRMRIILEALRARDGDGESGGGGGGGGGDGGHPFDSSMFTVDLELAMSDPQAASLESLIRRSQAMRLE